MLSLSIFTQMLYTYTNLKSNLKVLDSEADLWGGDELWLRKQFGVSENLVLNLAFQLSLGLDALFSHFPGLGELLDSFIYKENSFKMH